MVTDTHADTLTHMQHNDPAQYTVLGWVKRNGGEYQYNIIERFTSIWISI